ncbi:MAG: DUF3500 domain-containing protein [Planctomycetota bacterium]
MKALGSRLLLAGVFALSFALAAAREGARRDEAAASMAKAAQSFLDGLVEPQRAKASFAFDSPVRLDWHFVPRDRQGLPIGDLSETSRKQLDALIDCGLSSKGHAKLDGVLKLENVLRGTEGAWRDPAKYHVAIFGTPGVDPWGWRLEGHHFTAHFTSVDEDEIAVTPNFVGANPARVGDGVDAGFELLAGEDAQARSFASSLTAVELERAHLAGNTPDDVLLLPTRAKLDTPPSGLCAKDLDPAQRAALTAIVDSYFADLSKDLAERERARFAKHSLDQLFFAWSGDRQAKKPWYWRVQGDYFAIEFVYPRGEVNHAHRIWRDFERDLGGDALREHLAHEKK